MYSRAEGLMSGIGMIGFALNALREVVFNDRRGRLLLMRFETLTTEPQRALAAIRDFTGLPPFEHDPEHIEPDYDALLFDARFGAPGLHAMGLRVQSPVRSTVLPPDLIAKYASDAFWELPDGLPEGMRLMQS